MSASPRGNAPTLTALFGDGDVAARKQRTFQLMEIAEEMLQAEECKSRRMRALLRRKGSLKMLYPGELARYPDALYRAHCREIIARVKKGEDLSPGTDAELLVLFCETSMKAPLASQFIHAYEEVFHRVYPEAKALADHVGREAWTGSTEEIIAEARRKLARRRDVL